MTAHKNKFIGRVEIFPMKGGWTYVKVPIKYTEKIIHKALWGYIPAEITIGKTTWQTSLLPMKNKQYFIALNVKVRKKEKIIVGSNISVEFSVR